MKWPKASFTNFVIVLVGTSLIFLATAWAAEGLSTAFADVTLHHVPLGVAYKVIGSAKKSLLIRNLGDKTVRVEVDVLPPDLKQLRRGAAAIPDVRWVQVHPAILDLPPHAEREYEVFLSVPDEDQYRKRLYQVMLWSHSIPTGGEGITVSAGLLSRLQFSAGL